ncbi:2-dehydropantoate 2-reductase [Trinickia dabaoshanensis]|uniref:2-dehydropantoate 2-reductase n=1 Tax=Trinickia dabaoshanensis TaxID=564714 RepID=A0A2N7VGT4_9BURK|nr:2-dehydropantoate 2-reductase [Trinickia dabaoshanensis]PMS16356.1 2-dehydropantoate 2-reductase [Trinickia dabaoshanensis]
MRILVVGAGAVGGYFGGRMALAGQDVTFLVREARARELAANGLVIKSPRGDATLSEVKTVLSSQIDAPYDLVLLSCKAYDLDSAMASFAPAVGPSTTILPLLNGMRHLDVLRNRFGNASVLGGVCLIAATLDASRAIVQMTNMHAIVFGELDGTKSARVEAIAGALRSGGFDVEAIDAIVQQMWEKWVFLATLAGSTCLFRASVGEILSAPGGEAAMRALFDECASVAAEHGHAMREPFAERSRAMLFAPGSSLTASMLRDIENGLRTEGDHVLGDLLARLRAEKPTDAAPTLLELAYTHVKAYEARHGR